MDYMDQSVDCKVCGRETSMIVTKVCPICESEQKEAARAAEWAAKSDTEKAIVILTREGTGVWLSPHEAKFILNLIKGTGLTFQALREANIKRLPQFKNCHMEPAHSKPDGSDWTPSDWLEAVVGELGEYANFHKKFRRGDITFEEFRAHAAKELADTQTYLDILALRCLDVPGWGPHPTGIDLGQATVEKFNEVSERVGADVHLTGKL